MSQKRESALFGSLSIGLQKVADFGEELQLLCVDGRGSRSRSRSGLFGRCLLRRLFGSLLLLRILVGKETSGFSRDAGAGRHDDLDKPEDREGKEKELNDGREEGAVAKTVAPAFTRASYVLGPV